MRKQLGQVPRILWRAVSLAQHRLLMTDYDGTLAPFTEKRMDAAPVQRSVELLRDIVVGHGTTVAVVSGRPIDELDLLLGPQPFIEVGEHGWESRMPGEEVVKKPVPPRTAEALEEAARAAADCGWQSRIERKRSGVVLHTRGMEREQAVTLEQQCLDLWGREATNGTVHLQRVDGGVEIRAAGIDKGTVVDTLLSQAPRDTVAVFVGDELTDEDAFAAVQDRGYGVRVGLNDRPSLASGYLPEPAAVTVFLEEWVRVTRPR